MDEAIKKGLAGLLLLCLIVGSAIILSPPVSSQKGSPSSPSMTTTTPVVRPTSPGSPHTVLPSSSITETPAPVLGRIDSVDTSNLGLGRTTYAYITLTNTGTVPITKVRTEITAGRDFGFPIGYQSRFFVQELYDRIEPGDTATLRQSFDLPLYEGIIPLEGTYEVTVKVFANDWYNLGEWSGQVYLSG
jgi:hypothetical protein